MIKFSVIVTVYNEERSVIPVYYSLKKVMDIIGESYELIFVNDGSRDKSLEVLKSIKLSPANLIIVDLAKHRGQSTAMQAGFDSAGGEMIITLDGDLQNEPEDIILLYDEMIKGKYDIICGWRYLRKDPLNRLVISKIACILLRAITKENIHDFGCSLRIFKREVLSNIYFSGGMHRFFVLIMHKLGYKIGEIKVTHNHRRFGKSKYNLHNRLFECLVDFTRILLFDTRKALNCKIKYQINRIIKK